jgi:propionyl-CoA synthetase
MTYFYLMSCTVTISSSKYDVDYGKSLHKPQEYWAEIAEDVIWTKKWDRVLDDTASPFTKWFVGGRLSLCYNAVDRHVDEGHGKRLAIVWESPITGKKASLNYAELQKKVGSLI